MAVALCGAGQGVAASRAWRPMAACGLGRRRIASAQEVGKCQSSPFSSR
jgi:hypothetical protein